MHENQQKKDTIFELKTGNGCSPCKKRRTQKKSAPFPTWEEISENG